MNRKDLLLSWYETLYASLGPSGWWPGESAFEIAVGAILTQNTNWTNAGKAITQLRLHNLLQPEKMDQLSSEELALFIRPAGYFRVKAARLKNLLFFLNAECNYDLSILKKMDTSRLRLKLLEIKGIGPETADSILLYALDKPSFVVDAYTKRILNRHALVHEDIHYHELRDFFMDHLPEDATLYNEYHALLVRAGKTWCAKKNPHCVKCPLQLYL